MRTRSIYRLSDGFLTGQQISLEPWDDEKAKAHLPAGHGFVDGVHDHRLHRVDPKTRQVVAHTPPQDQNQPRFDELLARAGEVNAADRLIAALELKQHRPLRELQVDPSNKTARAMLEAIEQQIAEHRTRRAASLAQLRALNRSPTP